MITKEVLLENLPKKFRSVITQDTVDFINNAEEDELVIDEFRDNFLTYSKILLEGKYNLEMYVNAVKFVTHKLLDRTDSDAWRLTFPDRWEKLSTDCAEEPDKANRLASSYANRYKTSKLVTQILQQTIVPSYIYNAPMFQEALLELSQIMKTSKSDIARVNAANAILNHTKAPEESNVNLNIGIKNSETISDLYEVMGELAEQQLDMIGKGTPIEVIAESKLIPSSHKEAE